jgi:GDPmannose 4,6-dehydratase
MKNKIALICGISGQDGSLLAKFLLGKGYQVWGTSRDAQGSTFQNLTKLQIKNQIRFLSMNPEDFRSVLVCLKKSMADEVYFLAGQSSVGLSFEQPAETIQSITIGVLNILEAAKFLDWPLKIYHAGSSECFGDTKGIPAEETTSFFPVSPYAVAKSSAFWLVDNYRSAYGLFACTGILFNHESPLRPARFVTQKIITAAKRIAAGSKEKLELGRLDISRDWGWAQEYVEAMWLILQQETPEDYVIATGQTHTLESFVNESFSFFNLNWRDHVIQNKEFMRPTDLAISVGNPNKAKMNLGWEAKYTMKDIVRKMILEEID